MSTFFQSRSAKQRLKSKSNWLEAGDEFYDFTVKKNVAHKNEMAKLI